MTKEKILITDLDGTLVQDSKKITEADKQTLHELQKKMKIGIATGRSVKEIKFIEEQANIKVDVRIGFNGAAIEIGDQPIFERVLDQSTIEKLLNYIQEKELVFDALDGVQRIGTHQSDEKDKLWNMELVEPENLFSTLLTKKIFKINIRPEKHLSDEILDEMQHKFPELAICKSGESRIEVTSPNITKGNAIKLLREKYDLDVITIGDSENDVSMFQESDQSFCISHASEDVQQHAEKIVDHFYEILEELPLGG